MKKTQILCDFRTKCEVMQMYTDIAAGGNRETPPVSLTILGSFELTVGGQSVSALREHPSRLRSLLCYLILHRDRAVTHEELIETFYSDEKQRDPVGALKMQILRLRGVLHPLPETDASPILSRRGTYQWSPALPCRVDAEDFEALCLAAEEPRKSDLECLALYRSALPLYGGGLHLERNEPLWNRTLATRYFNRYLTAVQRCAALLNNCGEYAEAEALCLRAVAEDPLNEALYAPAFLAMLRQKKYADLRREYLALAELLRKELGVHPSEELQQLYARCMKEDTPNERDLGTVMASLSDAEHEKGAFFCSFEQFKNIYQLELRRIRRSCECLHVLMLTVTGANGKPLPAKSAQTLMFSVRQSILNSLRQSDIVAQCSANQFIVLLPCANYENSMMVSRRITDAYRTNHPQSAARLTCQIREPELL